MHRFLFGVGLGALCLFSRANASKPEFIPLPIEPFALSADGRVVVGSTLFGVVPRTAVRWTRNNGTIPLVGGAFATYSAYDVTPDGSTIVGEGIHPFGNSAFRWDEQAGIEYFGSPNSPLAAGLNVSDDGSVIAGRARKPFRWTREAGATFPDDEECGFQINAGSVATTITPDGENLYFLDYDDEDPDGPTWHLALWNDRECTVLDEDRTFTPLSRLFVSADGSVVTGAAENRPLNRPDYPVRWTSVGGVQELLEHPLAQGRSFGITADGQTIIGSATVPNLGAFIWDEWHGAQSLQTVLETRYNLADELAGWTLTEARAISPDGRFIAGVGIGPTSLEQGFLATVPEPSGAILAMIAILTCIAFLSQSQCGRRMST